MENVNELIEKILANREKLDEMLGSVAGDQDWQPAPGEWSFRFVAAHLATTDQECYLDRVVRISAGENPRFASYFNTGRDFSTMELSASLQAWAQTRRQIIDLVRSLPEEKLSLSGVHEAFGKLTVVDVLKLMDDHDHEHIHDLEAVLEKYHG